MNSDYQNSIPEDLRVVMDAHLDRVEEALLNTKATRQERRAIVGDVELQILEMVGNAGDEIPSLGAFETLIGALDGPKKYAKSFETRKDTPSNRRSYRKMLSPWTWCSVGTLVLSVFVIFGFLSEEGGSSKVVAPVMLIVMVGAGVTMPLAVRGYNHSAKANTINRNVAIAVFIMCSLVALNVVLLCLSSMEPQQTILFALAALGWCSVNSMCIRISKSLIRNSASVVGDASTLFANDVKKTPLDVGVELGG